MTGRFAQFRFAAAAFGAVIWAVAGVSLTGPSAHAFTMETLSTNGENTTRFADPNERSKNFRPGHAAVRPGRSHRAAQCRPDAISPVRAAQRLRTARTRPAATVCWSMIFSETGSHPRITSEGRLFPDHALTQRKADRHGQIDPRLSHARRERRQRLGAHDHRHHLVVEIGVAGALGNAVRQHMAAAVEAEA